jgi:hypothetical protein
MNEGGAGPRRVTPGMIVITVAVVVVGALFSRWRHDVLIAALRNVALTVAIVAALLALLAAVEFLLRRRARLWGRMAWLATVSAVPLWRLFSGGSAGTAMIAGVVWAVTLGALVVLMFRHPEYGR